MRFSRRRPLRTHRLAVIVVRSKKKQINKVYHLQVNFRSFGERINIRVPNDALRGFSSKKKKKKTVLACYTGCYSVSHASGRNDLCTEVRCVYFLFFFSLLPFCCRSRGFCSDVVIEEYIANYAKPSIRTGWNAFAYWFHPTLPHPDHHYDFFFSSSFDHPSPPLTLNTHAHTHTHKWIE